MRKAGDLPRLSDYKRTQGKAIRSLRRKLQRSFKQHLTNEEVAEYWSHSRYGDYFKSHTLELFRT